MQVICSWGLLSKSEYLIMPKGTKFTGLSRLGLRTGAYANFVFCVHQERKDVEGEQARQVLWKTAVSISISKGAFINTCGGGGWCKKGGPYQFLTPVRGGGLKKIMTNFCVKFKFTCFSMGLTHNFHGKKGGPEIVWGLKGEVEKFLW